MAIVYTLLIPPVCWSHGGSSRFEPQEVFSTELTRQWVCGHDNKIPNLYSTSDFQLKNNNAELQTRTGSSPIVSLETNLLFLRLSESDGIYPKTGMGPSKLLQLSGGDPSPNLPVKTVQAQLSHLAYFLPFLLLVLNKGGPVTHAIFDDRMLTIEPVEHRISTRMPVCVASFGVCFNKRASIVTNTL